MSVLQDMTKDIMTTKATKASRLTPVAGENPMTVQEVAKVIPNDLPDRFMSSEELGVAAASLREHAATLIGVADSIDALIESSARRTPTVDPKVAKAEAKKAAEKAADERAKANKPDDGSEEFKERLDRLSAEAQAAVFKSADDTKKESPFNSLPREVPKAEPQPAGWECPTHGDLSLTTVKPRKGEPYLMCGIGDCEEFQS